MLDGAQLVERPRNRRVAELAPDVVERADDVDAARGAEVGDREPGELDGDVAEDTDARPAVP
jgi:hypothetical protein